jgi:hypothetical protein
MFALSSSRAEQVNTISSTAAAGDGIKPMIHTTQGPMKPEQIVNYLTYCNYRHNRTISPHVTPEQWEKVYGPNTPTMERCYQEEQAHG